MSKEDLIKDYAERATPALAREIVGQAVTEAVLELVAPMAEQFVGEYFERNREEILDKMAAHVEAWLESGLHKVLDEFLEDETRSLKEALDG